MHHRARASAKSPLGEALAYIAKYRDSLGCFLTDGRVEIDSNTVERTIGPRVGDVIIDGTTTAHLHGKGRKERSMPLWRSAAGSRPFPGSDP